MTPNRRRRVLVTDAGRGSAVAVIRSLGRAGWDVISADSNANSPGFRSKFTRWTLRYPRVDLDPAAAAKSILREAQRRKVDLVVPVTDDVMLPLLAHWDAHEGAGIIAAPDPNTLVQVSDKAATLRLAKRVGVPVPRSRLIGSVAEARQQVAELGWPVVVKPRSSRTYTSENGLERHEVSYARDEEELVRSIRRYGRRMVLLQEYCVGEGYGVELLLCKGRPLAAFQHRRLREVPVTGGASSFRESVPLDAELYGYSTTLLGSLAYTGLAMVEFRVGPNGPCLMEVNGRIWGSLPLAVRSGIDFPRLMASMYLGELDVDQPLREYQTGVRSRNLALEMAWIASVLRGSSTAFPPRPRRRQAVAVAARLFYPGDGYDLLTADDPLPGIIEVANLVRLAAQRAKGIA